MPAPTTNEYLSVIPLGGLAIVYWLRDKYMYNRADRWYTFTKTQFRVLWMIYPLWIFLGWTLGLQTNRGQAAAALFTTTGQHIVGHYTIIGILNDSFSMTHQQLVSFFLGMAISYIWTIFWLIVSDDSDRLSEGAGQVDHVVNHTCRCDQ